MRAAPDVLYRVSTDGGQSFAPAVNLTGSPETEGIGAAGNAGPASEPLAFEVDRTAPAAPSFDAPAPGARVAPGAVRFAGHAEPGALVTVEVAGPARPVTAATDGSWEVSIELAAGPHVATATATDAAGNVSAAVERSVEARSGHAGSCGGCGAGSGGASIVLALLAALSLAPAGSARRRRRGGVGVAGAVAGRSRGPGGEPNGPIRPKVAIRNLTGEASAWPNIP